MLTGRRVREQRSPPVQSAYNRGPAAGGRASLGLRARSSAGEHPPYKREVAGSIPAAPTKHPTLPAVTHRRGRPCATLCLCMSLRQLLTVDRSGTPRPALVTSWMRHLRARNLAPKTLTVYSSAALDLDRWLSERGHKAGWDAVTRHHAGGVHRRPPRPARAGHASNRYRALQQLFRWLADEEEIAANPFDRMRPPVCPSSRSRCSGRRRSPCCSATCSGKTFVDRRDTAILSVFIDTGCRREEVATLTLDRVDLDVGEITVIGKGRRTRTLRAGPEGDRGPGPLPTGPGGRPLGVPAQPLAGREEPGTDDAERRLPDGQATRRRGGPAGRLPAPVAALVRPRLAGRGRQRGRPDARDRVGVPGRCSPATPRRRPTNAPARRIPCRPRRHAGARAAQWAASATGRVEPKDGEIRLASEVSGKIVEVLAKTNDQVKAGDPLLRIDDRDYYVKIAAAAAEAGVRERERAEEQVTGLALDRRNAEDAVFKANEDVFAAHEAFDAAYRADEDGQGQRRRRRSGSQDASVATGGRRQTRRKSWQRSKPSPACLCRCGSKSSLALARADLTSAELALERTRVRAPADGTVLNVLAKVGETAVPSPDSAARRVRRSVEPPASRRSRRARRCQGSCRPASGRESRRIPGQDVRRYGDVDLAVAWRAAHRDAWPAPAERRRSRRSDG